MIIVGSRFPVSRIVASNGKNCWKRPRTVSLHWYRRMSALGMQVPDVNIQNSTEAMKRSIYIHDRPVF
jgi:hypothetical protein